MYVWEYARTHVWRRLRIARPTTKNTIFSQRSSTAAAAATSSSGKNRLPESGEVATPWLPESAQVPRHCFYNVFIVTWLFSALTTNEQQLYHSTTAAVTRASSALEQPKVATRPSKPITHNIAHRHVKPVSKVANFPDPLDSAGLSSEEPESRWNLRLASLSHFTPACSSSTFSFLLAVFLEGSLFRLV